MPIVDYFLTIKYCLKVDTDTGEVLETKIVDKDKATEKPVKKVVKDENPEPVAILDDNKLNFTSAAIKLMGANDGDKLDIKYEQNGNITIPVIGNNDVFGTKGGTKLTKAGTLSYRGAKNVELKKYGTEFKIVSHPSKEGLFILTSDIEIVSKLKGDENVNLEEDPVFDLDMTDLVDNKDAKVTEIDASFFKL